MADDKQIYLREKTARMIATIAAIAVFISGLSFGVKFNIPEDAAISYYMVTCIFSPIVVFIILYFVILKGRERKLQEEYKDWRDDVANRIFSGNDSEEIEVYLKSFETDYRDFHYKSLSDNASRFFFKFIGNDIKFIVRDKTGTEIKEEQIAISIDNFPYFESRFNYY